MKITKSKLKQLVKEELSELGFASSQESDTFPLGNDGRQALLDWANDRPGAEVDVPYTRVMVDEPIVDDGTGLKLVFTLLPDG